MGWKSLLYAGFNGGHVKPSQVSESMHGMSAASKRMRDSEQVDGEIAVKE